MVERSRVIGVVSDWNWHLSAEDRVQLIPGFLDRLSCQQPTALGVETSGHGSMNLSVSMPFDWPISFEQFGAFALAANSDDAGS